MEFAKIILFFGRVLPDKRVKHQIWGGDRNPDLFWCQNRSKNFVIKFEIPIYKDRNFSFSGFCANPHKSEFLRFFGHLIRSLLLYISSATTACPPPVHWLLSLPLEFVAKRWQAHKSVPRTTTWTPWRGLRTVQRSPSFACLLLLFRPKMSTPVTKEHIIMINMKK